MEVGCDIAAGRVVRRLAVTLKPRKHEGKDLLGGDIQVAAASSYRQPE